MMDAQQDQRDRKKQLKRAMVEHDTLGDFIRLVPTLRSPHAGDHHGGRSKTCCLLPPLQFLQPCNTPPPPPPVIFLHFYEEGGWLLFK